MKTLLRIAAVIFLVTFAIISCKSQAQGVSQKKSTIVKQAKVVHQIVKIPITASGLLSANEEVLLSFKTGGLIKSIYVNEGENVKKGQLLAQLDLSEISAYREQAESALDKAKRDYERVKNLYNQNVATLEQLQNSETALHVAKANKQIALFNEKHSKISAPVNGKILKKFKEDGELVASGSPVLAFGSTSEAYILKVGLADRDVVQVGPGDSASVTFDAFPGENFIGFITHIAGTATQGNGTFEVQIKLQKSQNKLLSGLFGKATIFPQTELKMAIIPTDAINEAAGIKGYVYVINDNNLAEKKEVIIAHILGDKTAISRGLTDVDYVINEGNAYLTDGIPVESKN